MAISPTSMYLNSQTMMNTSVQTQTAGSFPVSPVERLVVSSGMDSPAMKELLTPDSKSTSFQPPLVTFDAQAQVTSAAEGVMGNLIDIKV